MHVQAIVLYLMLLGLLALSLGRVGTRHEKALQAGYRTLAQVREEIAVKTVAQESLDEAVRERRRLEQEITRISEEEKRRLASELHDGVCQHLTVALLYCTALEQQKAAGKRLDGSHLRKLREMLEESMGMAYDVAHGLSPLNFGAESLGSALEHLARQVRETAGLSCELVEGEDTSIEDQQASLHLYRIAQEAITNAIKHGRPQHIKMMLRCSASCIQLQVEDDGCGIPADRNESGGMGLRIMAYRADMLGGQLAMEGVASGGTRVICHVPRNHIDGGKTSNDPEFAELSASPDPQRQNDVSHGEANRISC
jgi:signal transduction histidine kinase